MSSDTTLTPRTDGPKEGEVWADVNADPTVVDVVKEVGDEKQSGPWSWVVRTVMNDVFLACSRRAHRVTW